MSKHPHLVNRAYAFLLLIMGAYGFLARYMEQDDLQFTALIPAIFGIVLLPMSGPMKRENKVIAHIVVLLTLLIGGMMIGMLAKSGFEPGRKTYIFGIIMVASFVATAIYVKGFIDKKKAKQAG